MGNITTKIDENTLTSKSIQKGKSAVYTHPDQHQPGAKLDAGKTRVGLVLSGFPRALLHVSQVGTKGAIKYSEYGFLQVPDGCKRYTDAMMRHWIKEAMGEEYDIGTEEEPGTEELHAACVAWNALARLEMILREKESK